MKTKNSVLLLVFALSAYSQSSYYWHNGKKVSLNENSNKHFIAYKDTDSADVFKVLKNKKFIVQNKGKLDKNKSSFKNRNLSINSYDWKIVENLSKDEVLKMKLNKAYASKSFTWIDGKDIVTSNFFYVKLKALKDTNILNDFTQKENVVIDNQNKYMPLWFTIDCKLNYLDDALAISNKWYETGFFESVQPDFIVEDFFSCVNDPNFNNQWGLNNTGQNGWSANTDIKLCNARTITAGSNDVIVAVVDEGVELNHPDLTNMHPLSYDGASGTSPSVVSGSHGMACAGIIGANTNNNLGVTGIASGCRIMSISANFNGGINIYQQFADGIGFARINGASVMSNSWGGGPANALVDNAITAAINNGRNGLGITMVFATGNNNGAVSWPANSNANIISVGAMSPCGQRKNPLSCDNVNNTENWGSNFGNTLDVVAPGVLIPTTDRQGSNGYTSGDYTPNFNGTSAATPHVSGLAALIISHRPSLTGQQVRDIIERTCQKVGGYSYVTTAGRPNGTWNSEMGYGLINAHAALLEAEIVACPTITNINNANYNNGGNYNVSDCNINVTNSIIQNNSKVVFDHTVSTQLNGDFEVQLGSELEIK